MVGEAERKLAAWALRKRPSVGSDRIERRGAVRALEQESTSRRAISQNGEATGGGGQGSRRGRRMSQSLRSLSTHRQQAPSER